MPARMFFAAALMVGSFCSAASAAQTLSSATGYVQVQDASVADPGEIEVSTSYVRCEGTGPMSPGGGFSGNGLNVRLTGGVGDRSELSIGYLSVDNAYGEARALTVAGKVRLFYNRHAQLALVAGALYTNWSSDVAIGLDWPFWFARTLELGLPSVVSVYVALDKGWGSEGESGWRTTTTHGLIYDHYSSSTQTLIHGLPFPSTSTGDIRSSSFLKPQFGVKVTNGDWTILGDYKPELSIGASTYAYASQVWSLAVRKKTAGDWAATAGVTSFNLPYTDSAPGFFLDVSYAPGN